jgi:ATP-binding cassette, subfamily B, bacterial
LAVSVIDARSHLSPQEAVSKNRLYGIWLIIKGYRLAFGLSLLWISIAAVAKMVTFILLRDLVDHILAQSTIEQNTLILYALAFIALAAVEGGFTYYAGRLAAFTAERVAERLRNLLFDHLQRLSFAYHGKARTGDLIQRVTSDVDMLRRLFSEQAIGIGRLLLPFVVNSIAIIALHWQLGLISIAVVPFIIFVSYFFFREISKRYDKFQDQEGALSSTLQENLTGVRVVKAFARQRYEEEKFEKENEKKYQLGKHLLMSHALYWPTVDTFSWTQMLIGWSIGATMAINGTISVGTYLAYAGLLSAIVWPIRNMGRLLVQGSQALVSYDRVAEILREERESLTDGLHSAPSGRMQGEVIFKSVEFSYENQNATAPVLHDISFTCKPGQIVALLGSTGSGKTSLVNLLPRFYDYTGGSITLDGVELRDYAREFLRQNMGIVEQEPFLFSRSIRDNIAYGAGRPVTTEEIEAAAKTAAIHDTISTFPNGYNTLVGERGVTLSGGQKQRVALARTLLKNPRILILDDSTSSVDPETEGEIREALNTLMNDRTTFIIAHRIQSVMIADLILVLDKGRIVQSGNHDELVAQDGIYREIYNVQSMIETELEKELHSVGL